ncbi:MAG: hypothetical protein JEZ08_25465 [Clostridiales bacterium]|nr:hypothetical protein [Clostridiales bacterium]
MKSKINFKNNPGISYNLFLTKDDGEPRLFHELNEVTTIPQNERKDPIYNILEKNCDLKFCTIETSEDFNFITLEHFVIFATDSNGNCFGTIGGFGHINDKEYPVGYVTKDGKCGKIATFVKEFLELVNYYPYWLDVIEYRRKGEEYSTELLEKKYSMNTDLYLENQKYITNVLNLKKNEKSIDLLISNLKDDERFIVFSHRLENSL